MLTKQLFHKKYLIFILLSLFIILSFVTGCSNTSTKQVNHTQQSKEQELTEKIQETAQIKGNLEVHYIDVGQADSILIILPNKQTILIDGGNNNDGELVVNYLKDQGIKKVNHVIGTHPHEDHIGGLDVAISSFDVEKVYLPKVTHTTKTYEDLLNAIKNKKLKVTEVKGGIKLEAGEGVTAVFLAPNSTDYDSLNDYSAVLKLTYGNTSFLFTGDAEKISEDEMLQKYKDQLSSDVLKIGHHGSTTSSSLAFIKAVSPSFSVISVGKDNDYDHPAKEIIERLVNEGVHYFRTDLQGTIIAYSDGEEISFNQSGLASVDKKGDISIAPDNWETSKTTMPVNGKTKESTLVDGVEITSINLNSETVVITNTGNTNVDLSGWKLVSVKGNQEFVFPVGIIIKPDQSIKVVSGPNTEEASNTLVWTKNNIWNNDGDPGELYDKNGNLIFRYK